MLLNANTVNIADSVTISDSDFCLYTIFNTLNPLTK